MSLWHEATRSGRCLRIGHRGAAGLAPQNTLRAFETALKHGADDYLVKPFHVEELLARINALVRRASGWSKPVLRCGPVLLDTTAQTVSVNDKPADLTSYEYKVLEYLMLHAGELVSKADLTEHIYQQDFDRDSNVLEVFIGRLRRKLDPEGTLKPIETVRGRGYRFAIPRSEADEA